MRNTQNRTNVRYLPAVLALVLVCALMITGCMSLGLIGPRAAGAEAAEVTYEEPAADPSVALYVATKNANSVVGVITNTQTWSRSYGVQESAYAQGSGVVIREGGYILTNNHVIESGDSYQILMPDGTKVEAEIVGTDSSTDLAVLKVKERADELVPVTMASISDLKVGSTVIAIGNPGGEVLANTVTQGIVSALERTSVNSSNTSRSIDYIQHDAAINNGNSGGGLFNYKGELVGINTLKYSGSAYSSVTFEGLGFAIPVDTVQDISTQLIETGKVSRPGLGITCASWSGPDEPLQSNAPASVCVYSVNADSAAEKAGIKQYDFIYEADGQRITSMMDLTKVLDSHKEGDTITVKVVRYNSVGYQNNNYNNMFGYGFGYGYGYGYGNDNNNSNGNGGMGNGQLVVGNGYEIVSMDVTLQLIESKD